MYHLGSDKNSSRLIKLNTEKADLWYYKNCKELGCELWNNEIRKSKLTITFRQKGIDMWHCKDIFGSKSPSPTSIFTV